ncbi:MAG: hypothetical protein KIT87_00125 [Anaerolineae bacterium]|nr:hypothetical protein [Anaerolineae bacterium]
MRLNPYVYGVLVLALFLGSIGVAQSAGWWSTSGKVTASGERVAPTGANVDEIKGWMTLGDVSKAYGVSVEAIVTEFKLPADTTSAAQLKNLESSTFSVTALRDWLRQRSGP